jgi:ABC-2 type transport system ATP-binding protein
MTTTTPSTRAGTATAAQPAERGLALRIHSLRKAFGDTVVLDGLDLDVVEGTVVALLGPNGAGKTTTVRILATLLRPDAGEALVAGHDVVVDPAAVRAVIGVTGQFSAVDSLLSGEENLLLMGELHHLGRAESRRRAHDLLARFDLLDAAGQVAMTYSGGMRRRLDLAMTLMGDPRIIFLDEPTTGLDPRSRRTMWQIVRDLVADGVTVLLTTQYLDEADELADRVVLLDHGRVVAQGTPDELKGLIPGGHARLHFGDVAARDAAALLVDDASPDDDAPVLQVPTDGTPTALMDLLSRLETAGVPVERVTVHSPDLDEVFLTLTGTAHSGTTDAAVPDSEVSR